MLITGRLQCYHFRQVIMHVATDGLNHPKWSMCWWGGCGVPYGLIAAEDDWLARIQVSNSLYLCQWSSYVAAYGVSILQFQFSVVYLIKIKH
jgi:hypothetical protein